MKRAALLLAAAGIIAPVSTQASANDAPADANPAMSADWLDRPLLLERIVTRHLADGKAITITQRWHISITRLGEGYRVAATDGTTSVDAPPRLATLAGMAAQSMTLQSSFSLALGSEGDERPGVAKQDQALIGALRQLQSRLSESGGAPSHALALAQIEAAAIRGSQTPWPAGLLTGPAGEVTTSRMIDLGASGMGEVTVNQRLDRDVGNREVGPGGIALRRHITSRLAGSERITIESWNLRTAN